MPIQVIVLGALAVCVQHRVGTRTVSHLVRSSSLLDHIQHAYIHLLSPTSSSPLQLVTFHHSSVEWGLPTAVVLVLRQRPLRLLFPFPYFRLSASARSPPTSLPADMRHGNISDNRLSTRVGSPISRVRATPALHINPER